MPEVTRPAEAAPESDADSARDGRDFEKWALLGVLAIVLLCVLAVVRGRGVSPTTPEDGPDARDIVRVEIGGSPRGSDAGSREAPLSGPGPSTGPSSKGTAAQTTEGGAPQIDPTDGPVEPLPHTDSDVRTYVVQPGETLSQIAERELGSMHRAGEIVRLNGIEDPDRLRAGDELRLPAR